MNNTVKDAEAPTVAGLADHRSIPLDRLAGEEVGTAAENLRHVLPADGSGRVTTAEFGSSI